MKVKQALKLKNKLVQELNDLMAKLHQNNSVIEGNLRDYSTKTLLAEIYSKVDELTVLKTRIHRANTPVYDKIFLLAELKSVVKNLKSLDCTNGIATDYYSRNDSKTIKTSEITSVERDNEVKFLISRIDEIQDELDEFNATVEINFED
jgi:hypothetical protein